MALSRHWNAYGFWKYSCGCAQYQDGWDYCVDHKNFREVLEDLDEEQSDAV